jgi:translation initiation factor IF-2
MLEPKQVEEIIGTVAVQAVFNITKVGIVAGCLVQSGKVTRNSYVRVIRNNIVIFPKKEGAHGELGTLKRLKDSVAEVKAGYECGITVKNFEDFHEGDEIEVYELKEVKQKL